MNYPESTTILDLVAMRYELRMVGELYDFLCERGFSNLAYISMLPARENLSISFFLILSNEMMNQLTLTTGDRWFAAKVSHSDR